MPGFPDAPRNCGSSGKYLYAVAGNVPAQAKHGLNGAPGFVFGSVTHSSSIGCARSSHDATLFFDAKINPNPWDVTHHPMRV